MFVVEVVVDDVYLLTFIFRYRLINQLNILFNVSFNVSFNYPSTVGDCLRASAVGAFVVWFGQ